MVDVHIYVQSDLSGDLKNLAEYVFAQSGHCGAAVRAFLNFSQEAPLSALHVFVGDYSEMGIAAGVTKHSGEVLYNATRNHWISPLAPATSCQDNTIAHELTHRLRIRGALVNLEKSFPSSRILEEGFATFVARKTAVQPDPPSVPLLGKMPLDLASGDAAMKKVLSCMSEPDSGCVNPEDSIEVQLFCCAKQSASPQVVSLTSAVDGTAQERGVYFLYEESDGNGFFTLIDAESGSGTVWRRFVLTHPPCSSFLS